MQTDIENPPAQELLSPQGSTIITLLMRKRVALTENKLNKQLLRSFPQDECSIINQSQQNAANNLNQDEGSFIVSFQGRLYVIMSIGRAIPAESFDVALHHALDLQKGKKLVSRHKAHVMIFPLESDENMGQAMTQAIAITRLAQALAGMGESLAVFWNQAETLIDVPHLDQIGDELTLGLKQHQNDGENTAAFLPVTFWVGFRLFNVEQLRIGLTQGLATFTGYELEIAPVSYNESELIQYLYNLVGYLFKQGSVLQPGQSLSLGENNFQLAINESVNGRVPHLVLQPFNTN